MTHSAHEYHENYSKDQVLHDGCGECEYRSVQPDIAIGHMDTGTFVRAWARATKLNKEGLPDGARAELPTLRALWAIQCQLENLGVPIGMLPVIMTL